MNETELTRRVIQASGPPAVDDLTTFLRKRVADDRRILQSVHAPITVGPQHQIAVGDTTALVPLGRFTAHLDALEQLLDLHDQDLRWILTSSGLGASTEQHKASAAAHMDALRLHALEYADHPDYKENWRP